MKKVIVLSFFILFTIESCFEKLDFAGMFITKESVNDRFEQSDEWNSLNGYITIPVSTDNYKLCFFADSHLGETKNFDAILDSAKTDQSIAIVVLGDICLGHTKDYNTLQNHLLSHNSLPIFKIVGNHDLYFDGWNEYFKRFGSSTYYFSIQTPVASDLYICLDTGSGTLGDKQLAWFKSILQTERPKFRNCIILTHNHLYRIPEFYVTKSPISPIPIEELKLLMEFFAKYNVNMVIMAHVHVPKTKVIGYTTYITVSACLDGFYNPNYLTLESKNGILNYEFKYLSKER